ncbi:hypothetical protein ADIARSV_4160 [Arcticibacter svalbardensis MN12-7]|uniref:DUF4861 domain-containing protein n=1 Tax=Arcticibacter svalbardensis MN12-7 TaxID=1150600 RepID=R9GLS4_9SPHI|nr:DUF4861 family protein [Arcticibacter svalbardensis]EOR92648.1 hypothetical protein ADIARSV_4160 [Arcticibacter svalbardensis MN12-7]
MRFSNFFLLILCAGNLLTANAQTTTTLQISNPSSLTYFDKVIEVPWKTINKIDTAKLIVIESDTKMQIPFQLEKKGTSNVVNLLIQISLNSYQNKNILITTGQREKFASKTYGRYVPERLDDFAWENDKIAYRMYGKALETTPKDNAYGMDVWVKRTDRLILNERYKRGDYHIDHGDGMDYYHVGFTLGAGNMMPYLNDSIYYSKNYVEYKVLDNGPLRTSFQLFYNEWQVGDQKVKVTKTFSLDAGDWLNKIEVNYSGSNVKNLPVVAGIIGRPEPGVKYFNEQNGIMSYWEPQHGPDGVTALSCLFPSAVQKMAEIKGQLLTFAKTDEQGAITYYSGATWNRQSTFTNNNAWVKYLEDFKESLVAKIVIQKISQ